MNFKERFSSEKSDIIRLESESPDGKFVKFNGGVTSANHLEKIGAQMEWIDESSFKLPSGWRKFSNSSGLTFFTEKEETKPTLAW